MNTEFTEFIYEYYYYLTRVTCNALPPTLLIIRLMNTKTFYNKHWLDYGKPKGTNPVYVFLVSFTYFMYLFIRPEFEKWSFDLYKAEIFCGTFFI